MNRGGCPILGRIHHVAATEAINVQLFRDSENKNEEKHKENAGERPSFMPIE